jgi:cysteine-rich repeat protein
MEKPSRRPKSIFSIAAILSAMAAATVQAATFNVTDTTGLIDALTEAQNNDQDDTINLVAGEYDASGATFTYVPDNTAGSEEKFGLTIQGEDREATILDGGGLNRVMRITTSALTGGEDGIEITIRNLTFQNGRVTGSGSIGGGLLVESLETALLVDNCLFKDNFATNGGAAADLLAELGDATLTNSVFIGNTTDGFSGGVELFGNINVVAINNVFFDNHAGDIAGAALIQFNFGDGTGERIVVVNNTAVSNTSVDDGGGIYVAMADGGPERMDIFNNILFGNTSAADGDDLYVEDTVSAVLGGPVLISHNDIGGLFLECANLGGCVSNVTEQDNLNLDPDLIDPANGNFHLAADSPMIDQGSADAPSLPDFDFEGEARVQGAAPDIGADEAVICGDGVVEGAEECDDNNASSGDCCDGDCQFEAADSACDDGDADTEDDQCDGAGACEGTPVDGGGDGGGCSLVL